MRRPGHVSRGTPVSGTGQVEHHGCDDPRRRARSTAGPTARAAHRRVGDGEPPRALLRPRLRARRHRARGALPHRPELARCRHLRRAVRRRCGSPGSGSRSTPTASTPTTSSSASRSCRRRSRSPGAPPPRRASRPPSPRRSPSASSSGRVVLLLLNVRAWRHVEEARPTVAVYLAATAVSAVLWAVSLGVGGTARWVLWAAAVAVDAAGTGGGHLARGPRTAAHGAPARTLRPVRHPRARRGRRWRGHRGARREVGRDRRSPSASPASSSRRRCGGTTSTSRPSHSEEELQESDDRDEETEGRGGRRAPRPVRLRPPAAHARRRHGRGRDRGSGAAHRRAPAVGRRVGARLRGRAVPGGIGADPRRHPAAAGARSGRGRPPRCRSPCSHASAPPLGPAAGRRAGRAVRRRSRVVGRCVRRARGARPRPRSGGAVDHVRGRATTGPWPPGSRGGG